MARSEAQVTERPKSVRYWVLVSDELMKGAPAWPSALRPVRADESVPPPDAFSRWWLFEDDDAPAELDGKKVELTLWCGRTAEDGPSETRVERRRVMT